MLLILSIFSYNTAAERVLVAFHTASRAAALDVHESLQTRGVSVTASSSSLGVAILDGPPGTLDTMQSHPDISLAELDVPRYPASWVSPLQCRGGCPYFNRRSPVLPGPPGTEILPWGIQMVQANSSKAGPSDIRKSGVWVCVLDTGVDASQPDLAASTRNNITGCGQYSGNCDQAFDKPSSNHGTHVTGTVAAIGGNSQMVVGVMDRGANVFAYNMFPGGSGTASTSVMGMLSCEEFVRKVAKTNPNARAVINQSYASFKPSSVERLVTDKMYASGRFLFSAAAGNEQIETKGALEYPAGYPSVISVGGVGCNGTVLPFSNQNKKVELAAPGSAVDSLIPGTVFPRATLVVSRPNSARPTIPVLSTAAVLGSALGAVTARLVDCGTGNNACTFAKGKICIMARSVGKDYSCKVQNAMSAGCVGLIFTNNNFDPSCAPLEGREIAGACARRDETYLPVVTTSNQDGDRMRAALKRGPVTATIKVRRGLKKTYTLLYSGTSMSAPHVTGVAARIWADFPQCTSADVRTALTSSAWQTGSRQRNNQTGYGIVQAASARTALAAMPCAATRKGSSS